MSLALAGCGGDTTEHVDLQVYNWWLKESETSAFNAVKSAHELAHPNVTVATQPNADARKARDVITDALLLGAPYSTFQANVGADVLRWTMVETWTPAGVAEQPTNYLHPIDSLFQRRHLVDRLPPELVDALWSGDPLHYYAVPINIHRLNMIFYNVRRVQDFKASHPRQNLFDIAVLCPSEGPESSEDLGIKIGIGGANTFVLTLLVFENILPALAGPEFYEDLFRGDPPDNWQVTVRSALRCARYLSRYVVPRGSQWEWDEAAHDVADPNGESTFTVMGDWLNAELKTALDQGIVDSTPFPDADPTRDTFVFTSDTFPVPLQAAHRDAVVDLLDTIASDQTQIAFSDKKGSIPALSDVAPLGERALATQRAFYDDSTDRVLATSGTNPIGFPQSQRMHDAGSDIDGLEDYLRVLMQPGATAATEDDVLALLEAALPMLRHWQELRRTGRPKPVTSP